MSATQAFSAPDINAEDYYERLGAPPSADASEINDHTKKYVAEFKPELSNHDNADERWKRFNDARQTLNSADPKADYDTFRGRFGAEQATEAYETWQANDALGSPDTVSARDLGLESEADESESRRRSDGERRQSSRQQRQQRSTREERQRERARRRREGETNVDTNSSKTYSTRATDNSQSTAATANARGESTDTEDSAESSTVGRVISHLRSTVDLATMEVSMMFSLLELVVVGYISYTLLVEFGLRRIPVPIVQDVGTVVVGLGIVGVLGYEYLDRFSDRLSDSVATGVGNQFTRSTSPERLLALPGVFAVLWSFVLLAGGSALTVLLLGVSVLSLYGRLRGLKKVVDLPEWAEYVEPVGGVVAALVFVALFVQSGQVTSGGPFASAGTAVLGGVGVALLGLIGAPVAAAGEQLHG